MTLLVEWLLVVVEVMAKVLLSVSVLLCLGVMAVVVVLRRSWWNELRKK